MEDEAIIALDTSMRLTLDGYDVVVAQSGEAAIDRIQTERRFHVVLMDIDLGSGIDGTETARRILEKTDVPIVFLTSHAEQAMAERVRGITRYGYVLKSSGEFVLRESITMALELFESQRRLRETEERYRAAFMTTPNAIAISAINGQYVDVNEGFTRFTGWAREDVIGRDSLEIGLWVDPSARASLVGQLVRHGGVDEFAAVIRRKDGSIVDGIMSARMITLNGEPHVVSVTRDVTRRLEAERHLIASELRYRVVFDNAAVGIVLTTLDGTITMSNRSVERITGLSSAELGGRSLDSLFEPLGPDASPLRYDLVIGGQTVRDDRTIVRADGERSAVTMSCTRVSDDTLQAIFHDISAIGSIRSIEETIRESEERMRFAVDGTHDGLWDWNLVTKKVYHSDRYAQMLGYEPDEIEASIDAHMALVHPADLAPLRARMESFLTAADATYDAVVRMYAADGTLRWIATRGRRVDDENGKPVRLVGFNTDVTGTKEQELEISRLLDEKAALLREVNHRVKNNLATVLSLIALKERTRPGLDLSDVRGQIDAIRLVHDKLTRSSEVVHVNLRDYLNDLLSPIAKLVPDSVRMNVQIDDLIASAGSATTIGLLINELATNAAKHGFRDETRGELHVRLSAAGDSVALSVANSGTSLPEKIDVENPRTLGLQLIRALALQLDATVAVTRSPVTTFSFSFPMASLLR